MGQRLAALVACVSATALPAWALDQGKAPVQTMAMAYFEPRGHRRSRISDTVPSGTARTGGLPTRSSAPCPRREGSSRSRLSY